MHARFILAALFAYSSANAIDVNFPAPPSNPNIIKDNYLGISWEISSFDTLCEYKIAAYKTANKICRGKNTRGDTSHNAELSIKHSGTNVQLSTHPRRWQRNGHICL